MDVLEFVDQACNGFVSDLCLIIGHFNDTFNVEEQVIVADKLNAFVIELMYEFMDILKTRMLLEKNLSEAALLVRAVDRFYRRIQGLHIIYSIFIWSSSPSPLILPLHNQKEYLDLVQQS